VVPPTYAWPEPSIAMLLGASSPMPQTSVE